MKAMILAAGLGTRLGLLTSKRPKPLVPVANRPVIDIVIEHLKRCGAREIVVNAHHYHQQIVDHIQGGRPYKIRIDVRVEPEILGTGGGIKNTVDFWDADPFVVINGDIITNIDIRRVYEFHKKNRGIATLVLHNHYPFNQIQIDEHFNVIDIADRNHPDRLAFTGIHIIEPELLNHIPDGVFSNIIDCYRMLIRRGESIKAYVSEGHYWRDVGTIKSYVLANKEALLDDPFLVAPGCRIDDSVRFNDWAVVGRNVSIEKGVEITRSILWEGVTLAKDVKIVDSIIVL